MSSTLPTSTAPVPEFAVGGGAPRSLAELIGQLGNVPLDRVLVDPPPGKATEADLVRWLEGADKRLCELVDGVLVEKAMGHYEDYLGQQLAFLIQSYLERLRLGLVFGAQAPMRVLPNQVRMPDVSFLGLDRIPANLFKEAILAKSPDLAVEVLSKSNTPGEIQRKLADYFDGGVRLVWIIDPQKRTCDIHTTTAAKTTIDENGLLDGGAILPGFQLNLGDLFARADQWVGQPEPASDDPPTL